MKRIWGHVVSLFVAGLAVSAALPACADNDQTIFIRAALAPSATRQGGACSWTDDPTQPFLLSAAVDIAFTDSYVAVLLIANQLIPRGDPNNNRAESNRVHIDGAVVSISTADGRFLREFTSYASSFLDPQNNNTPDFAPIGVTVFDAPAKAMIAGELPTRSARKTLLITIKVFGTTTGGKDVESGDFQLPLEACNGCLVSFAGADDPADTVHPNCKKPLEAAAGAADDGPCFYGQDVAIPCQTCVGFNPRCDPAQP